MFDLSPLTYEQLNDLAESVAAEKTNRLKIEETQALENIRGRLMALGIDPSDFAKKLLRNKKNKGSAHYVDPNNAENTWSGMGRRPKWVVAWMAQGKSIDALSV